MARGVFCGRLWFWGPGYYKLPGVMGAAESQVEESFESIPESGRPVVVM